MRALGALQEWIVSWWTFRPRKKIFSPPPPQIPQFAADTLPATLPLSLLKTPLLGFSIQNRLPPPPRLGLPLPPPRAEKNKKYPKCPPRYSDFLFPLQPPTPPPPIPKPTREGLISIRFGSVRVRLAPFGSVSGPFRLRFGVLGGSGKNAHLDNLSTKKGVSGP